MQHAMSFTHDEMKVDSFGLPPTLPLLQQLALLLPALPLQQLALLLLPTLPVSQQLALLHN